MLLINSQFATKKKGGGYRAAALHFVSNFDYTGCILFYIKWNVTGRLIFPQKDDENSMPDYLEALKHCELF